MFTGLIETTGTITDIKERGNYRILSIAASFADDDLRIGDSIACDGACLTVVSIVPHGFDVEVSQESLKKTIIGSYRAGTRLNVERALKMGDRLGGHFVTGHIDDTGQVKYVRQVGRSKEVAVRYDSRYDPLVVEKGSIAINGVSLTVNASHSGWCTVNLIPHTVQATTLAHLKAGEEVNLEFDMIGKYLLKIHNERNRNHSVTMQKLKESGW